MTENGHIVNDYIAGALGGAAGLVVGHPFDTAKVQLQTQQAGSPYRNTWEAIRNISTHGWVKGFFRGMGFPLVSYGVVNSVLFGVYGNTLRYLKTDTESKSSYSHIYIAGCVAGTMQLSVACPVDLVKVILQSQISKKGGGSSLTGQQYFRGPTECMKAVYQRGGVRQCYKGLGAMAVRDVPGFGYYMLIYEILFDTIEASGYGDSSGAVASIISGGCAGVISWATAMPMDTIKSLIQADSHGYYKGYWDCIQKTYSRGGVKAFFAGLLVNSVRSFPTNAVIFLVYSQVLKNLNDFDDQRVIKTPTSSLGTHAQ